MKLLSDWKDSLKAIEEHVDMYDVNLEDYVLSLDACDCYWRYEKEEHYLVWGQYDYDVKDETGNEYTSECKYFFKGEDFCLALVESDFGDDDSFLFLDNKRKIK